MPAVKTVMFLVAGSVMSSYVGELSQAVPAAMSQVLRRHMRTRLYTGRFATTILGATQRSNVATMLQPFESVLQHCVALKIVVANRPV